MRLTAPFSKNRDKHLAIVENAKYIKKWRNYLCATVFYACCESMDAIKPAEASWDHYEDNWRGVH